MYYEQEGYDVRLEWGHKGVEVLASSSLQSRTGSSSLQSRTGSSSDVTVIVDVLSFSTCVEIALSCGATIFPCRWRDERAEAFARSKNAILASKRQDARSSFSLSPSSLRTIPEGTRLVLPSPNGSALTLAASRYGTIIAGCLRNSQAVANYVQSRFQKITIIPCGERWPDGSLRPALEDLLGAGAIVSHLKGSKSPEALHAEILYTSLEKVEVQRLVANCASGIELVEIGYSNDVTLASEINASDCVPLYHDGKYLPA